MYKERVRCEVGARSRLLQERQTGEDAECSSEVATVLCVESDGISSFPTPSNKSHHRVRNIHFNILKFLNFDNVATFVEKLCFGMAVYWTSPGGIAKTNTPLGNGFALWATGGRGHFLSRIYVVTSWTLLSSFPLSPL